MSDHKPYLGEFEELVLLAVQLLGETAYGVTVRQKVSAAKGQDIAVGAIYASLERLEQKGFISSREGEKTAERGGRAKRYFRIEAAGALALSEAERVRSALRGAQQAGGVA